MNKILFARLVNFITCIGNNAVMDHSDLEALDAILNTAVSDAPKADYRLVEDMLGAMKEGRKIDAIRAHRMLTGLGLKESKDVIEKYWINQVAVHSS